MWRTIFLPSHQVCQVLFEVIQWARNSLFLNRLHQSTAHSVILLSGCHHGEYVEALGSLWTLRLLFLEILG